MYKSAQGVTTKSKVSKSFLYLPLLLLVLCLPSVATAATDPDEQDQPPTDEPDDFHIAVLYSTDSSIQSKIADYLLKTVILTPVNTQITAITDSSITSAEYSSPDLVIAIGEKNIADATGRFTGSGKLFIATDPGSYSQTIKTGTQQAVLYMTQPYCRQIQLIRQINDQWKTISYFNNKNKPVDDAQLAQCAGKFDMQTYPVNITSSEHLTNYLNDALDHSDLILALPDDEIFNPNTVKNILLTSYRHRKPVIAFSRNFVNAGALAAIHSDLDQIAISAISLIEQYISNDHEFTLTVNYPQSFDIDINSQVFRALDISIPDTAEMKLAIEISDAKK